MHIILKNKTTLLFDEFEFKCCIGEKGLTHNKLEGIKNMNIFSRTIIL